MTPFGSFAPAITGALRPAYVYPERVPVPELVTATATVPTACDGVTAVIVLLLTTVQDVTALPPNVTPDGQEVPKKPDPVSVTKVPPAKLPFDGDIAETEVGELLDPAMKDANDPA